MKDKVLFAKTGIAKIMALLVTLLTMFASCNFLGGEDVRMPTAGSNDPGKFNGMFKSVISGLGIQIYNEGKAFSIDSKGNLVFKTGWSGAYGSYDENGASTTGKYDVSNVAYVQYDLKSYSKGTFGIIVFGDSQNKNEQTFAEDEFLENEMVVRNVKIDIENKKEYSEILFSLSGKMDYGSKVRIENFAFYDENGKEVVPKYIKYADGEKPGDGDSDDNTGEGSTFSGVFKNPIPGQIDIGIWDNSFTCDNLPELVARDGSWWGGAFGWVEQEPEWSMPRKYDVSGIVRYSFDVVATTDVSGVYVTAFPAVDYKGQNGSADSYCETDWEDKEEQRKVTLDLKAGETRYCEKAFDAVSGRSTNRASLIGFGGGSTGGTLSIINITFYDSTGKEVVPKIAGEGGDTPDVPDDDSTKLTLDGVKYTVKTWFADDGWKELEDAVKYEETDYGIKLTVKQANGGAQWQGQFKVLSEIPVSANEKYNIAFTLWASQEVNATAKVHIVNNDDVFLDGSGDSQRVAAKTYQTIKHTGTFSEGGKLQVTFDFPGCQAGTVILIKFNDKDSSADEPSGGTPGVDPDKPNEGGNTGSEDNFIKLTVNEIDDGGTRGQLVFGDQAKMVDGTQYKMYVNDSNTVVRVFSKEIGDNNMEIQIKSDMKTTNILTYSYCRKLGEIFPDGAGDYTIKIVPYVGDVAGEPTELKYTLSAEKAGWMPKIENVELTADTFKGSLSGIKFDYTENSKIDHFNVFTLKSDVFRDGIKGDASKWGGNNLSLSVKNGGDILAGVSLSDVFKGGAGEYDIYFEPVDANDKIGTNVKVVKFTVEEDWLKESRVFTVTENTNDLFLTLNYKNVEGVTNYDLFVDLVEGDAESAEPKTFVKRLTQKVIEFKEDFSGLRIAYSLVCRKLGEVFKKGPGDYILKVLPVINGEADSSKAQYAKYTFSKERAGWWPQIDDFVDFKAEETEGSKLSKITIVTKNNAQTDDEVKSYNVFIIKSKIDDLYDCWDAVGDDKWYSNLNIGEEGVIVNPNGDIDATKTVFKNGAGKYYILFEPRKADGTIGNSVAIREIDVPDSWLSD